MTADRADRQRTADRPLAYSYRVSLGNGERFTVTITKKVAGDPPGAPANATITAPGETPPEPPPAPQAAPAPPRAPELAASVPDTWPSLLDELLGSGGDAELERRRPGRAQHRSPSASPAPSARSGRHTRARRWPLPVAVLAFALSVAIPVLLRTTASDSPGGTATTATSPPPARTTQAPPAPGTLERAAMLSWVRHALSRRAVIVSDEATVAALRAAGFRTARTFRSARSVRAAAVDYMLDIPGSVGPTGTPATTRTRLLRLSLPLARFGPASAREVFPDGTRAVRKRRPGDLAARKAGGRDLLDDPAVVPDAASRAALQRGRLDLRVEKALSTLARTGTVHVGAPLRDEAEAAVGQPIRSIVVTTAGVRATRAALSSLSALDRPQAVARIAPRTLRLTWRPAIALFSR